MNDTRERIVKRILKDSNFNPLFLEARKILALEKLSDQLNDLKSILESREK